MSGSKIKILHITFNMGFGGTEQVIRQIVDNSDSQKFCHEILCIQGKIGAIGQGLVNNGFYIEKINKRIGLDLSVAHYIRRYINRRDIDILHCHQYTPYFYGVLGSIATSAKVVFTEHGRFYPDRHNLKRRLLNPLLSLFTSKIIAISKATAGALVEFEYLNQRRITVIYNGIEDLNFSNAMRKELLEELNLRGSHRYIGTISRLEPIKNQSMMIDAFARIKKKAPDLKLLIIGDGSIKDQLDDKVNRLDLSDDVVFTGFIDNPQRFLKLLEVFLLSSFSEGTSMTILEAMSQSIPCIVTDVGGNPEIVINNKTGRVVPNDDTEAFSLAIMELINDRALLTNYGRECRARYLEMFSVTKMIKSYEEIYSSVTQ